MDFLSAISAIPGLISNFSGKTSNPYGDEQKQLAGRMAQISAAQTDTSNPLYKQLYGQYQDQNRQSLAQTIAETQAQNRMATGMGRTPLLDPNRGGETLFRGLMQGYQGLNNTADQQTRQALMQAQAGTGAAGTYYNNITPQAVAGNKSQLQGYQTISDMLRSGLGNQGYQSPYAGLYPTDQALQTANNNPNNPNRVNWNQPVISEGY